jgi:2'-5' RNA ligase
MAERYFSIPLPNHAGLSELTAYLRTALPEAGTRYADPATWHITLVYVPDAGEDAGDLEQVEVAAAPVFGLGGSSFRLFETPEGSAVTMRIDPSPQLTYLQAAIFYAVRALGLETSAYSWPGLYQPHVTLAYTERMPEGGYIDFPYYSMHLQVDEYALTGPDYAALRRFPLEERRADGQPVAEMGTVSDVLVVGEFKGSYPVVHNFPDVDIAALTKGDEEPVYVTLPVARDNATSDKRNYYSVTFVAELERQMRDKRPVANQGHVAEERRHLDFPTPVGYWIGAAKVGDLLWGKAYLPPGEARDMAQRMKAARTALATSIYGTGSSTWDAQRGVWDMDAEGFSLESIDFAPAERSGIAALAAVPEITSEMAGGPSRSKHNDESEETMGETNEKQIDRTVVIREMSAEDAAILPLVVRDAVLAASSERRMVAEMRQALNLDEKADVVQAVKGLIAEMAALRSTVIAQEIDAQVAEKVKIETARGIVAELVAARHPQKVEAVAGVVDEVIGGTAVKEMLEREVQRQMGPAVKRGSQPTGTDTNGKEKGNQYLEERPQ